VNYSGEVEIICYPGGSCRVRINIPLDFRLTEDEAAEKMRSIWAEYVTPRQKGLPLPSERKLPFKTA